MLQDESYQQNLKQRCLVDDNLFIL